MGDNEKETRRHVHVHVVYVNNHVHSALQSTERKRTEKSIHNTIYNSLSGLEKNTCMYMYMYIHIAVEVVADVYFSKPMRLLHIFIFLSR